MADHGEVQYETATGNDLPAHESGYEAFLEGTFILTTSVIIILIGLAIGGVLGHWLSAVLVILAGVIAGAISAWTGTRTASLAMLAVSALALLLNAYS